MTKYHIYGTLYNNINRISYTLSSLSELEPYKLFVVDNFSNDGSYEYLIDYSKKHKIDLHIVREKCTRGKGKDIALKMLYKNGPKAYDLVFYIDFDVIYGYKFINYIKNYKKFYKNSVTTAFGIGIAKLNKEGWRDLNCAEDFERFARMKSKGISILYNPKIRGKDKNYLDNFRGGDEAKYAKGFKFYLRTYKCWIDMQRGIAFNSFSEFFNNSKTKSFGRKIVWFTVYIVAKILGEYRYSESNNRKYTLGRYKS